jgi:RNA polymerase sigma factor (sigma-70 family)
VPVFSKNRGLLDRFRCGDRDALALVYRTYFDDVYRLARYGFSSRNGSRAPRLEREADRLDFVQDVFVKAFAEPARVAYDGLRPYRPFLLQIARNLRVDQLRQAARREGSHELPLQFDVDELCVELQNSQPPPADHDLHWERLVGETARVVETLDPETQRFAQLRYVEELSPADAAERLGVTRRRVRTLEGRLLTSVRRGLAKLGLLAEEV